MDWLTPDIKRMLVALAIGAVIGAEREYRSKSAGLRTMILVSVGACLFTILSIHIGTVSPDRIASTIVTGIGFLGAGVIFKDENRVTGITTATTIWMVAALGMAAGSGYFQTAYIGTGIILIVLIALVYVQRIIENTNQLRNYKIVCPYHIETLKKYEQLFKQCHLKALRGKQNKTYDTITGNWLVQGSIKHHEKFIEILLADDEIKEFDF